MRFSAQSNFLEQMWEHGAKPDPKEIQGEYEIEMVTGWIPNLSWAGHRKFIEEDPDKRGHVNGYNLVGSLQHLRRLGYFECYHVMHDDQVVLKLHYIKWPIVDYVVKIGSGLYLGKFFWKDNFKGFFFMRKIWDVSQLLPGMNSDPMFYVGKPRAFSFRKRNRRFDPDVTDLQDSIDYLAMSSFYWGKVYRMIWWALNLQEQGKKLSIVVRSPHDLVFLVAQGIRPSNIVMAGEFRTGYRLAITSDSDPDICREV